MYQFATAGNVTMIIRAIAPIHLLGTDYQTSDVLIIHDGSTASVIEYASIATDDYLGTFTGTVSGGNCLLQINMSSATSTFAKWGTLIFHFPPRRMPSSKSVKNKIRIRLIPNHFDYEILWRIILKI